MVKQWNGNNCPNRWGQTAACERLEGMETAAQKVGRETVGTGRRRLIFRDGDGGNICMMDSCTEIDDGIDWEIVDGNEKSHGGKHTPTAACVATG